MAQTPRRVSPSIKALRQASAPEAAPPAEPPLSAASPPQQEREVAREEEDTGLEMLSLPDEVLSARVPEPEPEPAPQEVTPRPARAPKRRAATPATPEPAPPARPSVAGSRLVLGLDPSLTDFGWSLIRFHAGHDPELVETGRWKTPASLPEPLRHMYQRERLSSLLQARPDIDWVGTETPAFGQSYSEGMYALFVQVQLAVWTARKRFVFLAVPTVKALGSLHLPGYTGVMAKPEMVRAAMSLLGSACPVTLNHNIADSVVVAWGTWRFSRLAESYLSPEDLTVKERASFVGTKPAASAKAAGKPKKGSEGMLTREGERWFNLPSPKYDPFYYTPPSGSSAKGGSPKLLAPITYR